MALAKTRDRPTRQGDTDLGGVEIVLGSGLDGAPVLVALQGRLVPDLLGHVAAVIAVQAVEVLAQPRLLQVVVGADGGHFALENTLGILELQLQREAATHLSADTNVSNGHTRIHARVGDHKDKPCFPQI